MERSLLNTLAAVVGRPLTTLTADAVGGGCIHQCWRLQDGSGQRWFVKSGRLARQDMFVCEAHALQVLARSSALKLPQVLAQGDDGQHAYLLLEWLDLYPSGDSRQLGAALAELHRVTAPEFGWAQDNYIGLTPQPNPRMDQWAEFWQQRLGYQLRLAQAAFPALHALGERVLVATPGLLAHQPDASLLHGDLWSGNAAFLGNGEPVIFDPASYYGDRESELALTELFGGFSRDFYAAYAASWPLPDAYQRRRPLYQLYHVLNHANLFGGGYATSAVRLMREVLAGE